MKRTACCTFHSLGGPKELGCDDYDHQSPFESPDPDSLPVLTFGDLIEWDVYRDASLEHGSMAADAVDVPPGAES